MPCCPRLPSANPNGERDLEVPHAGPDQAVQGLHHGLPVSRGAHHGQPPLTAAVGSTSGLDHRRCDAQVAWRRTCRYARPLPVRIRPPVRQPNAHAEDGPFHHQWLLGFHEDRPRRRLPRWNATLCALAPLPCGLRPDVIQPLPVREIHANVIPCRVLKGHRWAARLRSGSPTAPCPFAGGAEHGHDPAGAPPLGGDGDLPTAAPPGDELCPFVQHPQWRPPRCATREGPWGWIFAGKATVVFTVRRPAAAAWPSSI